MGEMDRGVRDDGWGKGTGGGIPIRRCRRICWACRPLSGRQNADKIPSTSGWDENDGLAQDYVNLRLRAICSGLIYDHTTGVQYLFETVSKSLKHIIKHIKVNAKHNTN